MIIPYFSILCKRKQENHFKTFGIFRLDTLLFFVRFFFFFVCPSEFFSLFLRLFKAPVPFLIALFRRDARLPPVLKRRTPALTASENMHYFLLLCFPPCPPAWREGASPAFAACKKAPGKSECPSNGSVYFASYTAVTEAVTAIVPARMPAVSAAAAIMTPSGAF